MHVRLGLAITSAPFFWRVIFVLLFIVVSYLALTPAPPQSIDLGWDKLNHMTAFATLAAVGCLSFAASSRHRIMVLLGLFTYGVAIEIIQFFLPGRSCEWGDLFADSIGITFGALVALFLLRIASRASSGKGQIKSDKKKPSG